MLSALKNLDSSSFEAESNTGILNNEFVHVAYQYAKAFYQGTIGRTEARDLIAQETGMSAGSAGDYVSNFSAMMKGERYTRTLNEFATRYYLTNIKLDFGIDAFAKAISAAKQHVAYYATLGHGRLAYVERVINDIIE